MTILLGPIDALINYWQIPKNITKPLKSKTEKKVSVVRPNIYGGGQGRVQIYGRDIW